jgi:hypothetical protein
MNVLVYQAINAVAAELSEIGIAKRHRNDQEDYYYRSIEDVLNALAPLLARHKLCVLPRMLEREGQSAGATAQLVTVRAAFDLVSAFDGSRHTIESFGEAIDESDKGTAKAISAAYKSAMIQTFCIPVTEEDADAKSPRLNCLAVSEPPEGWESWVGEVVEITRSCETSEAIDRLTTARRRVLAALQRSRPDLYASVGEAIAGRLAALQQPKEAQATQGSRKSRGRKQQKGAANAASQTAEAA